MENLSFATLRLGKTSVNEIKRINSLPEGIQPEPLSVAVVCTQVPQDLTAETLVFMWLGSDNSKGLATDWKQGFKAVGKVTSISRGEKYSDESTTKVDVFYIFPDAVSRLDLLNKAATNYYKCANLPIIGIDDHSNQTIRMIDSREELSDIGAFLSALNDVSCSFRNDICKVYPRISTIFKNEMEEKCEYLTPDWFKKEAEKYSDIDAQAQGLYQQFQALYSPEKLSNLKDDELLGYIFLGVNDHSLCNALEFDPQYAQFGSISGGTSYKYYLFYSKNEHSWKTSYGEGGQRAVSEAEAFEIGVQIRDALVEGARIIASHDMLATISDYSKLLNELNENIPQHITKMWFLKYYHMIFPNIISSFYSEAWQRYILCNLGIVPSDVQFIRMGQISLFINECNISPLVFGNIVIDNIGMPKSFYRIGTGENGAYFNEWHRLNYVAIGWNELGNLSDIYKDGADSKTIITDALKQTWGYDNRLASRKYGEINAFYSAVADSTYVVAMSGQNVLGIGIITGEYFFDNSKPYAHCRPVRWIKIFEGREMLPIENEGKLTTFYELKNSDNLCYLYALINGKSTKDDQNTAVKDAHNELAPISYHTGIDSNFPHNRILFGAPGTGKSYTLNREKDELLSVGGECERVTFHPDYSYANFVGTYKPVPCKDSDDKDSITYAYVPGPFMRTYVKALKNGRTDTPKPYLLLIEEINRANVAAVFGDVFQLLDRGNDEASEYPIQASEDVKKYLAAPENLGGCPDDYSQLRIPDNMFIWATMNSADQGVFPMDTAFKRRWEFDYIGVNDGEGSLAGLKVVLGKGEFARVVEWNTLRKAINEELISYRINEDKLLGPYFVAVNKMAGGNTLDADKFMRVFKSKVLMYLFDDAAKQKRASLFAGCDERSRNQYSRICDEFDTKGVFIFSSKVSDLFIDKPAEEGTI